MKDLPEPNRDRRRKPADEATLRRIAEGYNAGRSIRQLSVETGWCYGTVHRRVHLAQLAGMIKLRPRGGVTGPRNSR